jgi:phosphomannomutase
VSELQAVARAWAASDPDAETRAELEALLAAAEEGPEAAAELRDAFAGELTFGTAGLRGRLGPGPNRMNLVVVTRAAWGLGSWVLDQGLTGPVVIGCDARHNSRRFAEASAGVLAAQGVQAVLLDGVVPTPVLAATALRMRAAAAVMVTASHNPATDNGYKVYGPDARQIVPPADAEITSWIRRAPEHPLTASYDTTPYYTAGASHVAAYCDRARSLVGSRTTAAERTAVTAVYTAMHGVGAAVLVPLARDLGFAIHSVPAQHDPDPTFPTAAFPNPEEPHALDLARALAAELDADVVVANDPDADRCAVCIPDGDTYRQLTGDELGVLLGWWLHPQLPPGSYASTVVSSGMLERLAAHLGRPHHTTLTGFKWLSRADDVVFAYEEAIGYAIDPQHVRDKDGITAALAVLECVASLKAAGRSVVDVLAELGEVLGHHRQANSSIRSATPAEALARFEAFTSAVPPVIAGFRVERVEDLRTHPVRPTDALVVHLSGTAPHAPVVRAIVRPSGTEPKTKLYVEAVAATPDAAAAAAASVAAGLSGLV